MIVRDNWAVLRLYTKIAHILCIVLMVFIASAASAQNQSGAEILGTVTDPAGAAVSGVSVIITNVTTKISSQVTTNEKGLYDMPFLPPGSYTVEFNGAGFSRLVHQGIELELDQKARVNARLEIETLSQVVTVNGAPILNTDDSQRGTTFNSELVAELPTVGRDSSTLALLAPGTSTAQSNISGADPGRRSVNGSRAFSISATINGGSGVLPNSDNFLTLVPALAAVEEFDVIENNFTAEYDTGTSVLNIVTKGGTNRLHGSVFEYFENDYLNARNYFAEGKTPLRYNQPGGTLGGPILHNKLFFFLSYQDTINPSTTVTRESVPTLAVSQGDFTGLPTITDPTTGAPFANNQIPLQRIDSVAQKALAYWPTPNEPGNTNDFYRAAGQYLQTPIFDAKIDYQIKPQNTLSGASHVYWLTDDHTGSIPGPACFNNSERCGVQVSHSQQWSLTDHWIVSANKINELRFNFVRQFFNQGSPNQGRNLPEALGLTTVPQNYFPAFSITGAIPTSLGAGSHSGGAQEVFSYGDSFMWNRGKHSLKAGGEFDRYQYNVLSAWDSGTFGFDGVFTGVGYADFLLGLPSSYSLNAQPNTIGARRLSFAAFAQDDYHVTDALTLNIGLRYEGQGAFSEVENRLSNFSPSLENPGTNTPGAILFANDKNRILQSNHFGLAAPRIGVSWMPVHSWVVRSSYGIFFVPISAQRNYNSTPPGFSISESQQVTNLSNPTPIFELHQGPPQWSYPTASERTPAIQNGSSVTYYPFNASQAYMQQWHLSVQRQISSSMMVELSYVGTRGLHLLFPRDLNQVPESLLGPGNLQSSRPYAQYESVTTLNNDAVSNYNALQLQIQRRISRGLTFLANYTWSKSMDNCSLDLTTGSGCEYQNANAPRLTYAPSQFDQANRVVVAGAYDLPFGRARSFMNRGGIVNAVLGGWTASENFSANTGSPFTVLASKPNPALSGSLFANVSGNPKAESPTIAHWFNVNAFSNPASYEFGNSSRDILRGPGFWNLDASMSKDFPLLPSKENQYRLNLRGDFYDVMNHPNFGQPNSTVGSTATGTITSTVSSRQVQVGLSVSF